VETKKQKRERRKREKLEKKEKDIQDNLRQWDPNENPNATGDAYKTLFVSRINYQTSETKLKREFELYGPIKKIRMIKDKEGKPRGYAFIEYERERDMKAAFKAADGKKIDGRRVLVDVERGRTVKNWRPRKFAGGLGGTRLGGEDVNQKFSGREPPAIVAGAVPGVKTREGGTPRGSNTSGGSLTPRDNPPGHQRDNRGYRGPERDRDRGRDRERFDHHRDHHREHHHRDSRDVRERDRGGRMPERERFDMRTSGGAPAPPPPAGERFDRSRDHKKRKRSRSRSRSRSRERERERDPTDDDVRDYYKRR